MFRRKSEDEKVTLEAHEEQTEMVRVSEPETALISTDELLAFIVSLGYSKAEVEQIIKRVHALAAHAKRSHMGNTEMIDAIKTLEAEAVELLESLF